jgi:hypothetical protein
MTSACTYDGTLYFGTPDGKIKIMDGYVDGVTLADPNAYAEIEFSLLGAYSDLGTSNQKQIGILEPTFISEGSTPSCAVEARYDFDLTGITSTPESVTQAGTSLWDSEVWDTATWAPEYASARPSRGAVGIGAYVAIAIRGKAAARTILTGYRGTFSAGGFW